jgi:hypothetical protein
MLGINPLCEVELAQDDRARRLEAANGSGILFRHAVATERHTRSRWSALEIEDILQCDRNAMECASAALGGYFGIGRLRLLQSEVQGFSDERIQMTVLRHSLDLMASKLDGRYLPLGDKLANPKEIEVVEVSVRHI